MPCCAKAKRGARSFAPRSRQRYAQEASAKFSTALRPNCFDVPKTCLIGPRCMIKSFFTLHRRHRYRPFMLRSFAKAPNNRAVCDTTRPFLAKLLPGRVCARAGVKARGMARSAAKVTSIKSLPLFATDDAIGAALLGKDRMQEWRQIAPILEARGLPKVDHLMGGR